MYLFRHLRNPDVLAPATLLLLVAIGHWDQVLGISQPVGGDKSAFFFGLMSHYRTCLLEGYLPLWNELWGFGFPGLAESQTGALYPPHLVLYWLLPALDAFRWVFLLHRFAAAGLGYASMRGLGLKPLGAWVGTLTYVGGGFALGHLDHQWAVLGMVWLPPAFWATHTWLIRGSRAALVLLPVCLAMQLLVGHFQIAFMTLCCLLLYAIGLSNAECGYRRFGIWVFTTVLGVGLAAVQLLPTAALAGYVRSVQPAIGSADYLSSNALAPPMTTNLVLPYLYFREPLWREVVWTPLHSSPEECLSYVGLLPLVLALGGMWRWRRVGLVRCWTVIFLLSLWLSWGPFVPGFESLTKLPGFSFFRCAGRWSLVSGFFLGILAGWSVDHLRSTQRLWVWWQRLMVCLGVVLLLLAGWWWMLDGAARSGRPLPRSIQAMIDSLVPWDRTSESMVRNLARPQGWEDLSTYQSRRQWARLDRGRERYRLLNVWVDVLVHEILPTLGVCLAGLILLALARLRLRRNRWLIVALCLLDLGSFRILFPDTSAPIAKLVPDGPIFSKLAELPFGSRVVAPGGNLLQYWGLAPVLSFRTLDIPQPEPVSALLARLASGRMTNEKKSPTHRLLGLKALVYFDPHHFSDETFASSDDQLVWWLEGTDAYRKILGGRRTLRTVVVPLASEPVPALVVDQRQLTEETSPASYHGLYSKEELREVGTAKLLATQMGRREWSVTAREPAVLVLGETYLPGWKATIVEKKSVPVVPVDRYWQGVALEEPGTCTVHLSYHPPGLVLGIWISGLSLLGWLVLLWRWSPGFSLLWHAKACTPTRSAQVS